MSRWIWHLLPLPPCAYIRAVYAADLTYIRTSEHLCDGWAKTVCASYSWKMGKVFAAKKTRLSLKGYPKKAKRRLFFKNKVCGKTIQRPSRIIFWILTRPKILPTKLYPPLFHRVPLMLHGPKKVKLGSKKTQLFSSRGSFLFGD